MHARSIMSTPSHIPQIFGVVVFVFVVVVVVVKFPLLNLARYSLFYIKA